MARIPHNRPSLGAREAEAAQRTVAGGYVVRGPETSRFEEELCASLGLDAGHAVAVSSGTAALYLILEAMGARGKRVAISRYTCSAVAHAARMAGATVVPVDTVSGVHADVDLQMIAASGADLAIVAHMFGIPQRLGALGMPVIEDCAQSQGASIDGKPVGLQGEAGVFSFYATKMITSAGQGGMIVARDKRLVESVREILSYNLPAASAKMNFHITDVQSAVGRVQLSRLGELRERRARIFDRYAAAGLPLMTSRESAVSPVRYRAVVVDDRIDELAAALDAIDADTRIPVMTQELEFALPGTNAHCLAQQTLFIPIFPELADEDADRIIAAAQEVLAG
jgi:perosamine synthetase